MARPNTHNGGDHRQRSKRELMFVMFAVVVSNIFIRSLAREITAVTDDVRGRNPHACVLVAVPTVVSVAFLLVQLGAIFGIGLGDFIVWDRRSLAGYPGRLLWDGFALNFVATAITLLSYVLIEYAWFMS